MTEAAEKPLSQVVREVVTDNVRRGEASKERANQFLAELGQPPIPEQTFLQYGDYLTIYLPPGVTRDEARANKEKYAEQIIAGLQGVGDLGGITADRIAAVLRVGVR